MSGRSISYAAMGGALILSACAAPLTTRVGVEMTPLPQEQSCAPSPNLRTVGIPEVVARLKGGDFNRGEFENTEQFQARHASRLASVEKLAAAAGHEGVLPIEVPISHTSYDADRQRLKFGFAVGGLVESYHLGRSEVTIRSAKRKTGSYIGVNAFGVRKAIDRIVANELRVALSPEASITWPPGFKEFEIAADSTRAESIKKNGRVVLFGSLEPPYFSSRIERLTPKIDAPYDTTYHIDMLHFHARCALIVDRATGEVVRQFPVRKGAGF